MKLLTHLALALGLCTLLSSLPMTHAQEDATPSVNKKDNATPPGDELPAVPAAILPKKLLNTAKLNTKAKVYFVYMSRHACAICVNELPGILDAYKRMKGKKAEIVMLNCGNIEEDTKWVKNAKITFPVVAPGESEGIPFPYDGDSLLPFMVAMDPSGNKLGQANGPQVAAFVKGWKKIVKDYEKEERKAAKTKKSAPKDEPVDSPDDES